MTFGSITLLSLVGIGVVFFGAYKWSNRERTFKIKD